MTAATPFNELEHLTVELIAGDNSYDITTLVTEFYLHENIYFPFVYGSLAFLDNSALVSDIPLVGQEEIRINAKMFGNDKEIDRIWFVNGFGDSMHSQSGDWSRVKVSLLAHEQMRDAVANISKFVRGNVADIVSDIFSQYFFKEVRAISNGRTSHNIVIPYTTPIRAIQSILKHTFADDHSPLHLYEHLWQLPHETNTVLLKSYNAMQEDRIELDEADRFTPRVAGNLDSRGGIGSRFQNESTGRLEQFKFVNAYDTYRLTMNGAYAHRIDHIDLATKTYEKIRYDYRDHRDDMVNNDYITDRYHSSVSQSSPMIVRRYTNSKSYTGDNQSNLYDVEPLSKSRAMQIAQRADTVEIVGTGPYDPRIVPGKAIELGVKKNIGIAYDEETLDTSVNSGFYAVTGIEHHFRIGDERKYTARYRLTRDGPQA